MLVIAASIPDSSTPLSTVGDSERSIVLLTWPSAAAVALAASWSVVGRRRDRQTR